ncbi:MAG TPA: hypothetical protein VF733_05055 [Candidatus Saccharimonadales bacterium]
MEYRANRPVGKTADVMFGDREPFDTLRPEWNTKSLFNNGRTLGQLKASRVSMDFAYGDISLFHATICHAKS